MRNSGKSTSKAEIMGPEKNEIPDTSRRIDPDANPLTSFGRDSDFIDELIQGVYEKNSSSREMPKTTESETNTPKVRDRKKRSKNFRF
ncbi:hypothetical protein B0E43_08075 [Algoriphagus sp. A40]|nr:hypothetical protein B0E43_08075 [Algoriphagus sp. A40]